MLDNEAVFIRHADKGKWTVNIEELQEQFPKDEANLVQTVLESEFSDMKEIPLKLDGINRSLRLADKIFQELPLRCVFVAADSGKERPQLTRALVTYRLAQLEAKETKERGKDAKRVDMLQIDEADIAKLLADASPDTWTPYAKKIEDGEVIESEAIARWLNDMNGPDNQIDPAIHPHESAERYREAVRRLRGLVTSEQVPVVYFGAGHSGSLGQVRYEEQLGGNPATAQDSPEFCEAFFFDEQAKLIRTERTEI
jgi:hypothetical protein